jgi:hypothetical protein
MSKSKKEIKVGKWTSYLQRRNLVPEYTTKIVASFYLHAQQSDYICSLAQYLMPSSVSALKDEFPGREKREEKMELSLFPKDW